MKDMEKITLKIYDKSGKNVVKIYEAVPYDIPFGTVRALMAILNVEELDNQAELLKILATAWNKILDVLANVFPDCTDEEWDNLKTKEVLKAIIAIAKFAVTDMFAIPVEKN